MTVATQAHVHASENDDCDQRTHCYAYTGMQTFVYNEITMICDINKLPIPMWSVCHTIGGH